MLRVQDVTKNCLWAGTLFAAPALSHQWARHTSPAMTPCPGTLCTTDTTRTPYRPYHGGLRRELHGGWAVVAKERDTQKIGQERQAEEPPMLSSQGSVSCSPDQPCLTAGVRTGQTGGEVWPWTPAASARHPDSLHCKPARPASVPGPVAEPQSPSLMWGAIPATPSRAPHSQLSGESSELPGDCVHSGCVTSSIRLGPVGSGHSERKFLYLFCSKRPLRRPRKHSQAAGRGFRAEQELQCLMVSRAGHNSPSILGERHCGSENDPLKAQATAPGSHRGLRT